MPMATAVNQSDGHEITLVGSMIMIRRYCSWARFRQRNELEAEMFKTTMNW